MSYMVTMRPRYKTTLSKNVCCRTSMMARSVGLPSSCLLEKEMGPGRGGGMSRRSATDGRNVGGYL
jgi:hypothetical protein